MTKIHVAHSPDADDAFMFHALMTGKIDRGSLEPVDIQEDIETLNQKAMEGAYEATAISFHVYPYVADKYLLLTTGACFGDNYGPLVVASKVLKPKQLLKVQIGVPGKMTSAFLTLRLYEHHLAGEGKSGICYTQMPFDQIIDRVAEDKVQAGLIIHEGQLSYADKGLFKVVDLGEWWKKETGLPLPLGGIAIRRDLDPTLQAEIARSIHASIQYALEHKDEVVQAVLPYARGLDPERAAQFIGMYVNEMTVDMGRNGIKALKKLLDQGYEKGIITKKIDLDECLFDVRRGKIRAQVMSEPMPEPQPQEITQPLEPPSSEEPDSTD